MCRQIDVNSILLLLLLISAMAGAGTSKNIRRVFAWIKSGDGTELWTVYPRIALRVLLKNIFSFTFFKLRSSHDSCGGKGGTHLKR